MALVILISRGQASVQLNTVRQRQTPLGWARMFRRFCSAAVARVVDEAVRVDNGRRADILVVRPIRRAGGGAGRAQDAAVVSSINSAVRRLQALFVAFRQRLIIDQVGITERYCSKNGSISTIRSFSTLKTQQRLHRDLAVFRSFTSTLQASAFLPLMRMASEPHTPCAHERR
jgi:hypothetical protein